MLRTMAEVVVRRTEDLYAVELKDLRDLLDSAFRGNFDDHDWANALGGRHALVMEDGTMVAHAAVVPRTLIAGDRSLKSGYVEAVGTPRAHRHQGHATRAMQAINEIIAADYDLGALSTGVHSFYERLGWESWQGPTFVNGPDGRIRTPDEDAGIMVLRTDRTRDLDPTTALTCDPRTGDDW
jgi:aminoglycoside 2'-N-acetyltransferase I